MTDDFSFYFSERIVLRSLRCDYDAEDDGGPGVTKRFNRKINRNESFAGLLRVSIDSIDSQRYNCATVYRCTRIYITRIPRKSSE